MRRIAFVALMATALLLTVSAAYSATAGAVLQNWETITPNSGGSYEQRSFAGCIASSNKFYVVGGIRPDGTISSSIDAFDPAANSWSNLTTIPGTPRKDCAVVKVNYKPTGATASRDFIYIIGGFDADGNPVTNVDIYDLGDASNPAGWKTGASMPSGRGACVGVNNGNNSLQVYGGYPDSSYMVYTIATDSWAVSTHVPPAGIVDACGGFAGDQGGGYSHAYLFGGTTGAPAILGGSGTAVSDAYALTPGLYDRSAGDWFAVPALPEARKLAAAFVINTLGPDGTNHGIPLVFGGTRNDGSVAANVLGYMSTPYYGWYSGTKVASDLPVGLTNKPCVLQLGVSGTQYIYVLDNTSSAGVFYRAKINTGNYPGLPLPQLQQLYPQASRLIGNWEDMNADCPNQHEVPAYGVVSGKLYVIGGRNSTGTLLAANDCYDPSTNTWSGKAPMPVPTWRSACAVANGKIYVMGGSASSGSWLTTVQVYDPAMDTWVDSVNNPDLVAALPMGMQQFTAVTVTNPATGNVQIHTLGSRDQNNTAKGLNIHYIYDVATNTWTKGPNMDQPRNELMASVVQTKDSKGNTLFQWVYFGGGGTDSTQLGQMWRFDPMAAVPNWYTMPSSTKLPVAANTSGRFVTVTDSNGMEHAVEVGGQYGPAGNYNEVYTYHSPDEPLGLTYNWTYEGNMPGARGAHFAVGQIGDYLYVAGGSINGDLTKKAIWRAPVLPQTPPKPITSAADIIGLANGTSFELSSALTVTRVYTSVTTNITSFWIEDENRTAAIKVVQESGDTVNAGDMVTFTGTANADTDTRQKVITDAVVTVASSGNTLPKAVVINNRAIAGATKKDLVGRTDGVGLNNVGMLVKITGRVTVPISAMNSDMDYQPYFYIDDGTGLLDGTSTGTTPNTGIRVYLTDSMLIDPGDTTHYVTLRGIVGLDKDLATGKIVPAIYSDYYFKLSGSDADFSSTAPGE